MTNEPRVAAKIGGAIDPIAVATSAVRNVHTFLDTFPEPSRLGLQVLNSQVAILGLCEIVVRQQAFIDQWATSNGKPAAAITTLHRDDDGLVDEMTKVRYEAPKTWDSTAIKAIIRAIAETMSKSEAYAVLLDEREGQSEG